MTTRDEFVNAIRTIKEFCAEKNAFQCVSECPLEGVCGVRPVVLCKDCRHRDPEDHKCDCGQLERAGCVFPVDDNYWCAHGEKGETNAKD